MYYPLMFEPIYKQTIWGGNRLKTLFNRELPFERVGESWEISSRPGEMSLVRNGRMRGTPLAQLIASNPSGYMGSALCELEQFPLLIKLIDAQADLSVQVHPQDVDAKNEVWYIIYAPEGAQLGAGLAPGTKKDDFARALNDGNAEEFLVRIPVKTGDVVNIPAGTVHFLTAGLVIAEIQQNSDTTYRVYDYGRVDANGQQRQLHISEALAVIDFDADQCAPAKGLVREVNGGRIIFYCETDYYAIYEYCVDTHISEASDSERFFIFICVEGRCEIFAHGYSATVEAGDTVFIPAALGKYTIYGKARLIKSWAKNPR